jgi:DNA-binding beta-propeller fold protein YncE
MFFPRVISLLLAASLLFLAACAGPTPLLQRDAASLRQWPEPPLAPRVEWVKSVELPEDAGIAKGFWKRAAELLTGGDAHLIQRPYGVLYDDAGRLFIADPGAGAVHIMDTRGARSFSISGSKGVSFASPIGLAEDANNQLYITDSAAGTVYRYDLERNTLTPFLRELERPTGIAYSKANGLLYVSDTTGHRVVAFNAAGVVQFSLGDQEGPGLSPLNLPTDLAVDAKGQVYVTDPLRFKISIFSSKGKPVSAFGVMGDSVGEMNKPKGVAVDALGRIFVNDAMLDAVQVFDAAGQFLFSFGNEGTADGEFWMPSGICISGDHIFVADTFNQRVQVFRILPEPAPGSAPPSGGQQKKEVVR